MTHLGTVLFFMGMESSDYTLGVPITNALAFVVTSLVNYMMGESTSSTQALLGIMLVLVGSAISMMDDEDVKK